MKRIRYDRLAILLFAIFMFLFLLVAATLKITDIVKKPNLKVHSEVLMVEVYKYTSDTQTNVPGTQKQENRLCGLAVVECENEKVVERTDLDIIKELSSKYEVDWKLIESITRFETGNRTSRAYKELNNPGGLMKWSNEKNTMILMKFNTVEESYEFMIKNIKKNYLDLGLTTIEQIQQKYAPVGTNDNGTNKYWVNGVKRVYESLEV